MNKRQKKKGCRTCLGAGETVQGRGAYQRIISEEKANQKERIPLEVDAIRKFFPRSYTPAQMQQRMMELLEAGMEAYHVGDGREVGSVMTAIGTACTAARGI